MKKFIHWTLGLIALSSFAASQKPEVLEGNITGAQNHTYVEVPFHVPAGTARVTIQYAYTGRQERTTIDLGMEDPSRVRCWSGGNKHVLTVGLSDATPSCEPGAIPSGTWNVLLGVPNIRP
ncbi:MAG: PHP domain-containing protein, partial [Bryocella sp.]